MEANSPISEFCSYAHEDEEHLDELRSHLASLRRQVLMDDWHDRKIPAGGEWEPSIQEALEKADLILLLISPDFVHSDYCMDVETARALERHESKEAIVIPIFLRECMIDGLAFAKLQGTPRNCNWIANQKNSDKAYHEVAVAIRNVIWQRRGYGRATRVALHAFKPVENTPWAWLGRAALLFGVAASLVIMGIWFSAFVHQLFSANQALIVSGEKLLNQGEYAKAELECRKALNRLPESRPAQLCIDIAQLLSTELSHEQFETRVDALVKRNPGDNDYLLAVQGQSAASSEDFAKAEKFYQEAIALDSQFAHAYYGLGQVAQLQRQFEDAQDYYQRAVDLAPSNRRFRLNLASSLLEQGELKAAQDQYETLINQDNNLILAQVELIDLLLFRGENKEAGIRARDLNRQISNESKLWFAPLNNAKWFFNTNLDPIYLKQRSGKQAYIKLQFALANFLIGYSGASNTLVSEVNRDSPGVDQAIILFSYKVWRLGAKLGEQERLTTFLQMAEIPEWIE